MPFQIEILVHVSGPSQAQDDARYRAEANAFLNFEAAARHNVSEVAEGDQSNSSSLLRLRVDTNDTVTTATTMTSLGPTQRIEAIKDLFHSRLHDVTPARTPAQITALRTPAAVNLTSPALPWTSIKETPHLLIERTPAIPRPSTAPNKDTPSGPSGVYRRTQSDSWQTPPSVVPDSQPSPESVGPQTSSSPMLKRPFHYSSSPAEAYSSPSAKRVRRCSISPQSKLLLPETSSDRSLSQQPKPLGPSSSQQSVSTQSSEGVFPLDIHPRQNSKVGNATFSTHLTKPLVDLSNQASMQALQIECPLTRPIGKCERGHWRVSLAAWSREAKDGLWDFLADFVGRGQAGDTVWCRREMEDRWKLDSSEKENRTAGQVEVLRVFCWGEVVREVFLVMYVAGLNKKKTTSTKAEWIDASGQVVATAKGRYL